MKRLSSTAITAERSFSGIAEISAGSRRTLAGPESSETSSGSSITSASPLETLTFQPDRPYSSAARAGSWRAAGELKPRRYTARTGGRQEYSPGTDGSCAGR